MNLSNLEGTFSTLLTNIQGFLQGIGVTIFIIGIVIAGLMWATSFGNMQRTAAARAALTAAIIGFIIVLLASTLGGTLDSIF